MMASFFVGVALAGLVAWVSKLLQEGTQAFLCTYMKKQAKLSQDSIYRKFQFFPLLQKSTKKSLGWYPDILLSSIFNKQCSSYSHR